MHEGSVVIDVQSVVRDIPHLDKFCSVRRLHELVEQLQADPRFSVRICGRSEQGVAIHHVRFGRGRIKALIVGFPHCKEPICGLTVFSLLTLLKEAHPSLCGADVEWHVVPCIDPDGAILNEGWTQQAFTLENYMRNYYVQAPCDQVDMSFPVRHKRLVWEKPSHEAKIMMQLLDDVLPDFFFSLHNAWTGGAFFVMSRDVGRKYHEKLYELLDQQRFPLQRRPIWREVCEQYGEGISGMWSITRHYDHLEHSISEPEKLLAFGAASWDYLARIKPDALTMLTELGYVRHPKDESEAEVPGNLRHLKLRIDADSKYLATVVLEEWEKVKADLNTKSPLYRAVLGGGVLPVKDELHEGGRPLSLHPTRDILFNPQHNRSMTEGDRFQALMVDGGFWGLCQTYQFVRLLRDSTPTQAVQSAIERLERVYREALDEIERHVDLRAAEVIDCTTLARVQLGSGLVVLNALLERDGA